MNKEFDLIDIYLLVFLMIAVISSIPVNNQIETPSKNVVEKDSLFNKWRRIY